MTTPCEAFIKWFDTIPPSLRKYLAHVFRICTTEDTSQMAMLPEQSLTHFRNWALKTDFPMRIAARMFYIRSVFDMVIFHRHEIDTQLGSVSGRTDPGQKIVPISSRQWDETMESWKDLRKKELADSYIHSWASWMIRKQMKVS
ncbi:MAG: hypothetical protein MI862_15420 [Desulfobacterales bacterium]|nr:hypothetical protein [Desulfobacterales bacterium]